ncbi:MAG: AI-2E family transporter [Longimicrobiaceae bacterium]
MDANTPRDDSVLEPDVDPSAQATPVDAAAPQPDLSRTEHAIESPRARSVGVTTLTVLALLYTVYFARPFLLPLAFALLLNFLFSPLVRALARHRIRPPLGAGLVVLALLGGLALGVYELSGPVRSWAVKAPETLSTARQKLRELMRPIERASKQVETAAAAAGGGAATTPAREVVVRQESTVSKIVGVTQHFVTAVLEVVILLYFLLAGGDLFLQKLIKVLPTRSDKRKAVEIARETESSISTYLLTTAAMNVGEGIVVSFAMYLLGMPNPLLWGAMVAVLEFIPYLGAAVAIGVLGVAAITIFDSVGHALLVPGSFLLINLIQANVVSPLLLGHRLALNPVAILVALAFWFWIWGIPGAFIAVPLLATFKIFCDRIHSLAAVGEFLGMRDDDERRATVRA